MTSRLPYAAAVLAAAVAVAAANLYTALLVGNRACGGEFSSEPSLGSARSDYCGLFQNADARILLAGTFLLYSPVLILVLGGAAAIARRQERALWTVVAASVGMLIAVPVLAFALPA